MSDFHEVLFPMRLALGAVGGPERRTEILALASGREVRNATWAQSKRRWDVGSAATTVDRLRELIEFFEARCGRLYAFRFRDPFDHSSARGAQAVTPNDQVIGVGDGAAVEFQLLKRYGEHDRKIFKPRAETVVVAIDDAELREGWSVDGATGQILFESPPSAGTTITAGFEFDCPVRFETDQIQAVIESFGAGRVVSLGLVEILSSSS